METYECFVKSGGKKICVTRDILLKICNHNIEILINLIIRMRKREGMAMAHMYSKGWFVQELKKLGVRKINGRRLESYKAYVLAKEYEKATTK